MAGFSFFGETDKGSQYPAWTMVNQLKEIKEEYGQKERALASGLLDPASVPYIKEEIKKLHDKIESIAKSRPELTDKQKQKVEIEYGKLGNLIKDSLFTRSDMKLGLADAHEEARRMVNPLFTVDREVAIACKAKIIGGKVTRNDASKMFKIIGHYLVAATNIEHLRKDS
jgi:hypothetical protein